jgi:anti-sigma28 factor (negative regulator of flagellin synthesis)
MENSRLDKLRKQRVEVELPDWVKSGNTMTRKLYDATIERVKELKTQIKDGASKELKVTERTLVNAHIAEKAGVSDTNIRKDRQEGLLKFIKEQNNILLDMWKLDGGYPADGRRMSKPELEVAKTTLQKKVKDLENKKYREFFRELIDSQVIMKQSSLAERYTALQADYNTAQETIAHLRLTQQQLIKQLGEKN